MLLRTRVKTPSETNSRGPSRLSATTAALAWLAAAGGAIAILLIAASSADGGIYRVMQCDPTRGGARADLSFDRNSDHYASAANCAGGRGVTVRHAAEHSRKGHWGAWSLESPVGTRIKGIRARVAGAAAAGHIPELEIGLPGEAPRPFGRAAGPVHTESWRGTGAESFSARLHCARVGGCDRGAEAMLALRRLSLRVADLEKPLARLGGPLAATQTRRGTQALDAITTDRGAGLKKLFLEVNNKPLRAPRFRCELQRNAAIRMQPCPTRATHTFELDTTGRGFVQGINRLRLCADDYATAGQRNRGCARHKVRVDNECPVDHGSEPTHVRARLASNKTVARGERVRIVGRLTDGSDAPVRGARVCIATTVELPRRTEQLAATRLTDADGRFEAQLEPGPNRKVRVAHWPSATEVAERHLRLGVRARPALRVSPDRTLHNGERVHFAVRLHGPRANGRRFQIEVASGDGDWTVVRAKSTDASGRWRGSYRFHATTGTHTYGFRAVVPRQSGYPYEPGASATRRVRVRG